jgi:hypothetical protein
MAIRSLTCGAVLAVALGGCASKQQNAEPPARGTTATAQPPPQPRTSAMCPMMIDPATTQVSTSDTSDGVAIAFTTTSDVNEMRARVHHMADMHNQLTGIREGEMDSGMQHREMPGGTQGGIGTQNDTTLGDEIPSHEHLPGRQMVPSTATAEDVPGGARVVLVPADLSQLTALREDARLRADMMKRGQCPMSALTPS